MKLTIEIDVEQGEATSGASWCAWTSRGLKSLAWIIRNRTAEKPGLAQTVYGDDGTPVGRWQITER
jgi:hypothetical protein